MIRNTTAYILIILANIVLLAHAVFPHYHLEQQVCLNLAWCHHTDIASNTQPGHAGDVHDTDGTSTDCMLKQLVFLPAVPGRNVPVLLHLENITDCFNLPSGFSTGLPSAEFFKINPCLKSSPPLRSLLDFSQGLRAPPAV